LRNLRQIHTVDQQHICRTSLLRSPRLFHDHSSIHHYKRHQDKTLALHHTNH